MLLTSNYKLKKPEGTDNVNIDDFNYNADIIDENLKNHTHSKSQITDMPTSLKNPNALTISLNGTSQGAYDGSSAKSINITKDSVGLGNVTNESKATMFTNPALTGTPTAPTPASSTNSTQIATTAFVQSVASGKANSSHTHNYAGSSSAGGSATSALTCTGNSATATKLQTARTINGVTFDGSANITIKADPNAHTHDDRYYTESEVNSLLNNKANSSHNHTTMVGDNNSTINMSTGNDTFGLSKTNNVDISSWYGISFSNKCTGAGIQGAPSASIDVRTGNAYFAGDIYVKGQSTGLFQFVSNGKSSIATAITGKGVSASANDDFNSLASKIGQISQVNIINGVVSSTTYYYVPRKPSYALLVFSNKSYAYASYMNKNDGYTRLQRVGDGSTVSSYNTFCDANNNFYFKVITGDNSGMAFTLYWW